MTEDVRGDSPLASIRVLDLSRVLAGPYVGRMLADLGADVVKVEPPEGDVTRQWGRRIGGLSGYYTQQNAGKRNVCIDLRADGGPALVRELAQRADVLVENFRPGVMEQHGLSYEVLRGLNPRLVMLSISGFGQHGPESRRPAYAGVMHAESGLVERQAAIDGNAPVDLRISIADMNAALHGLVGLLSALVMRDRTGYGQHVDLAMLDAMIATDDYTHLALDGIPSSRGVVVNEVWDVAGGPILLAGDFRWIWRLLRDTHGLKDPTPAGASVEEKARCRHEAVAAFFASFDDPKALRAALDEAGLAYGEVRDPISAMASPTLAARGSVVQVDDRAGATRPVFRSPYRFSAATSTVRGGPPRRGEHNAAVLGEWLELPTQRVAELTVAGVLLDE